MEKPITGPAALSFSYLQHFPAHNGPAHRIALEPLPFRIGRDKKTTNYSISSKQISKEHAEIACSEDQFFIRDLGSTNGTFVNGRQIDKAVLHSGDIIHVAHEEFRFVRTQDGTVESNGSGLLFTEPVEGKVPASIVYGRQCLQEMLGQKSVQILFQPIVRLDTQDLIGYEALARGAHAHLSIKPGELFGLAERCGLAPSLSQMFREKAIEAASRLAGTGFLFLNLHPAEMGNDQLIHSLRALVGPDGWQLVLEINENAAGGDLPAWQKFRQQVHELDMEVAYDDFGAGQARVLELAELPPEFIKLDMGLIRNLHQSPSRQKLIQGIVKSSQDQGVQVIAEGVETGEEARVCKELGCNYGQGFLFGYPQP
jgi:EAL domain-containing protein (putative c-di-GMP-specific phosphodiesterase class I)